MRSLNEVELAAVSGAGAIEEAQDLVDSGITAESITGTLVNIYEGLVGATSYVIGRVAGDLHPSYYQ